MINGITFKGQIQSTNANKNSKGIKPTLKPDSFELSDNAKFKKTYDKAKAEIIKTLKEQGIEKCFILTKDGKILTEKTGDDKEVRLDLENLPSGCTLMHGHPNYLPLSSGDIACLLCSDLSVVEAITENGDYSKMAKEVPFTIKDYQKTYKDLEEELCLDVLKKLNIETEITEDDLIECYKKCAQICDYKDLSSKTNEEIKEDAKKSGFNLEDNCTYELLKSVYGFSFLLKGLDFDKEFDKKRNTIIKNIDLINETMENDVKLRQDFLKKLTKRYNIVYESNLKE